MKQFLWIGLFWLITVSALAQESEMILTGKVIDKSTNAPVAYANIGLEGTALGTASNTRGEFEFHIPAKHKSGKIAVSCLGYALYSMPIASITNKKAVIIYLNSKSYDLDAVTVRATPLTAEQVIEEVINHIPENYITDEFAMSSFYREYFREDQTYVGFAEASLEIYDEDAYFEVQNKLKEKVKLNEIRVSDIVNEGNYVLYIDINTALRGNVVRNWQFWKKALDKWKYKKVLLEVDGMEYYGDDLVYIIDYRLDSKKMGYFAGKAYIRTDDFAVLRLDVDARNYENDDRMTNGMPHYSKSTLIYNEYQGKLYLGYINATHKVNYTANEKAYYLEFFSEFFVNDIRTKGIEAEDYYYSMDEKSIFYQPRYRTYNPNYWHTYNLFEQSPENTTIISHLEVERSLEKQYRANGKLKLQQKFKPKSPFDDLSTDNGDQSRN